VALLLLAGLSSGGAGPSYLPDSVTPCLPCHNRGDADQVAEWRASPYSEAEGGRGCTHCHGRYCSGSEVPRTRAADPVPADTPGPIEAARLTVRATCTGEEVTAEVAVSNVGVGHLLPTGSPERTLVLEVAAHDRNEAPLPFRNDSTQPAVHRATVGLTRRDPATGSLPVASRISPGATVISCRLTWY